jgi:hypothetical protein
MLVWQNWTRSSLMGTVKTVGMLEEPATFSASAAYTLTVGREVIVEI